MAWLSCERCLTGYISASTFERVVEEVPDSIVAMCLQAFSDALWKNSTIPLWKNATPPYPGGGDPPTADQKKIAKEEALLHSATTSRTQPQSRAGEIAKQVPPETWEGRLRNCIADGPRLRSSNNDNKRMISHSANKAREKQQQQNGGGAFGTFEMTPNASY
ncbi:hypothetical protein Y032_0025g1177 [Ancylostoma ceylanicum]|uniref:Uncharacterized protein n=1 Tax=Ancylostoma ceylanicum TaxID=53326 RepID=A0A016UWI4_9BILA|nr:hypothetical protein Y032_0025g1177 [Ancylostoma ceylanicum]